MREVRETPSTVLVVQNDSHPLAKAPQSDSQLKWGGGAPIVFQKLRTTMMVALGGPLGIFFSFTCKEERRGVVMGLRMESDKSIRG